MSIAAPIGTGEAASVTRRVATLEGLLSKTREASTTSGIESFASALQSAGESSPPEPPEPAEAAPPEPGSGIPESGSAVTGLSTGGVAAPVSYEAPGAGAIGEVQAAESSASSPPPMASASSYPGIGTQGAYPGISAPSAYPATSTQGAYPVSSFPVAPTAGGAPAGEGAGGSSAYHSLIEQAAMRYGVEPAILHGLIEQESGFNPNARSSAGALGLTQLMPSTAASLGIVNPLNPAESIEGGARFLSEMLSKFGGNVSDALAAYNAGPGAVSTYGGVPPYPETEAYVSKVLANAQAYRTGG